MNLVGLVGDAHWSERVYPANPWWTVHKQLDVHPSPMLSTVEWRMQEKPQNTRKKPPEGGGHRSTFKYSWCPSGGSDEPEVSDRRKLQSGRGKGWSLLSHPPPCDGAPRPAQVQQWTAVRDVSFGCKLLHQLYSLSRQKLPILNPRGTTAGVTGPWLAGQNPPSLSLPPPSHEVDLWVCRHQFGLIAHSSIGYRQGGTAAFFALFFAFFQFWQNLCLLWRAFAFFSWQFLDFWRKFFLSLKNSSVWP